MVKQVSIKFFPRTDQILEGGKTPIYVRVVLDREKFDFSSKQFISNLSEWDEVTQRVRKKSPINGALSDIEYEVKEAFNFLKYNNRPLTAYALRKQLKGEKHEKLRFQDFIQDYYDNQVKDNPTHSNENQCS